jgi:hypothetical protein
MTTKSSYLVEIVGTFFSVYAILTVKVQNSYGEGYGQYTRGMPAGKPFQNKRSG